MLQEGRHSVRDAVERMRAERRVSAMLMFAGVALYVVLRLLGGGAS